MEEENNILPEKSQWKTDRIMGIAAIFISILSMFSVIYQSYLAREENELMRIQQSATVLPYLSFQNSHPDGNFALVISNKGVGPAFIKEVSFMAIDLENKDSLFFNNSDQLFEFIGQKSALLDAVSATTSTFRANMLLSQNERKNIIIYKDNTDNKGQYIRKEFEKFNVKYNIVYEDVYGTAWRLQSGVAGPVKEKK